MISLIMVVGIITLFVVGGLALSNIGRDANPHVEYKKSNKKDV